MNTLQKSVAPVAATLVLAAGVLAFVPRPNVSLDRSEHVPGTTFWRNLNSLCGGTHEGRITRSNNPDHLDRPVVMHVHDCHDDRVSVRSVSRDGVTRTWTFLRHGDDRLELRHEYRDPDGSPHAITGHGGFATNPGTERAQIFPADRGAVDNQAFMWNWVWMVEIHPEDRFVYFIQLVGTEVATRTEYDLRRTVDTGG